MPNIVMRTGAIAMIDVLGFRGIWRRFPPEDVVASLERLLEATTQEAKAYGGDAPDSVIGFVAPVFLSDTVAFGLATKPVDEVQRGMEIAGLSELVSFDTETLAGEAVRHTAALVGSLMRRAIGGSVPFAFRGAIAYGHFGMTDRFLIGEAVDEAAEFMNAAQGAIVGLTPSAAAYEQATTPTPGISNLVRYTVPVKPGRGINEPWSTLAVLPWGDTETSGTDLLTLFTRALSTDDPGLAEDVRQKRENTLAFLRFGGEASSAPLRALLAHAAQVPAQWDSSK